MVILVDVAGSPLASFPGTDVPKMVLINNGPWLGDGIVEGVDVLVNAVVRRGIVVKRPKRHATKQANLVDIVAIVIDDTVIQFCTVT